MSKSIIFVVICLSLYLSFVNRSVAEFVPIEDAIGQLEDDIEDLITDTTSADMCPIPACVPSLKPKPYDLDYYISELERGDLNTFIQLMTKLTAEQRQEVNTAFFAKHGKFIKDKIAMRGLLFTPNLKMALDRLMKTPEEIFAEDIHYAIHRTFVDIDRLTEILFTVNNYGLLLVADAYGNKYGRTIHFEIEQKLRRNPLARDLLAMRAKNGRKERKRINERKAAKYAQIIYDNKGGGSWQPLFNQLIVKDNGDQLHLLFDTFKAMHGISIERFIEKYANSKIEPVYQNIVYMIKYPYKYLAKQLFNTMSGLATDDRDLMRIIIGRGEIDLASIEDAFNDLPEAHKKGKNLRAMIMSDIHLSRKYATILTSILSARATIHG